MKTKICNKCNRELPISEFNKNKNSKDGLANICKECCKKYYDEPINRARRMISGYRRMDKIYMFGNVIDFDAQWIVDNIFTQPCKHCGESDWHKIGCNRLDNSKGHTKDNVEPCCLSCNSKLASNEYNKQFRKKHYNCTY